MDEILQSILTTHLHKYDTLQKDLLAKDITLDKNGYQRTFNDFYKMQRRKKEWYNYYFSLLEQVKKNKDITFKQILEQIYAEQHRVEPSFSSKLVATVRPDMPIYDRFVRENLLLVVPAQHKLANIRVQGYLCAYEELQRKMSVLIQDTIFIKTLKPAFDEKFQSYAHFTDVKKLDFLLWQHRRDSKSAEQ